MADHLVRTRGSGLAVFLVDDDDEDRRIFQNVLHDLNPEISIKLFSNAPDLLAQMEAHGTPPDILFLDLHMPGMDGEACIKVLRDNPALDDMCVVVYSSTMDMKRVDRLFDLGANRYLRKPLTINSLRMALERTISSCQSDPIGGLSVINCTE